jgi:hypothetical protein
MATNYGNPASCNTLSQYPNDTAADTAATAAGHGTDFSLRCRRCTTITQPTVFRSAAVSVAGLNSNNNDGDGI